MVEGSKDDVVVEEIGVELEMWFGERLDFVGEKRKVRVCEGSDGEFRGSKRGGLRIVDQENEGGVREFGRMGLSFDINELVFGYGEISGCVSGVRENAQLSMEGVDVLSVENEGGGDNGKGKEIEKGDNDENEVAIDARENAQLSVEGVGILSVENEGGGDDGKGKEIEKGENDGSKVGIDLNLDVRENAQLRLLSLEGDIGNGDDKGKGKVIEKGESDESEVGLTLDLDLGKVEVKDCVVESVSMGDGKRRYTREEKGKAKVLDSWISLGNSSMDLDAGIDLDERTKATFSVLNSLLTVERSDLGKELELPGVVIGDQCAGVLERRERDLYMFTLSAQQRQLEAEETLRRQREAEEMLRRQREAEEMLRRQREAEGVEEAEERLRLSFLHRQRVFEELLSRQREAEEIMRLSAVQRQSEAAEIMRLKALETQREAARRERAHKLQCQLARPLQGNCQRGPLEKEQKAPSVGISTGSENLPNLFSTALNMHRERISKQKSVELIRWTHSKDRSRNISRPSVPSLLDLSLKVLADNADAIVSLETVPDILKRRLCYLLCDFRRMNVKTLDLFLRGSPDEIRIKDCSWITENEFTKSFESFDPRNLRVLQLDLCGQCFLDDIIRKRLGKSSKSLPGLGVISLRSACRLSDDGLKVLVQLAPALCSINIGQCSLLTSAGIIDLANDLGSSLRELFIDYCTGVDAARIAPVFKKFENLEVLSVAGILNVDDGFVSEIMNACGRNMKDLDLADCEKLTDVSLQSIGKHCAGLRALNIANLKKMTDWGLLNLADGCRSIQKLKLYGNDFSDEALATFLEMCGESIGDLSLNHVSKVGPSTALSLARCSKKLSSLDLSWCRRVTNEALGLIVDNCFSLKLLKLFGCTQITNYFLDGHSNSLVRIIGMNLTSVLEHVGMLEDNEPLLHYSPLPSLPESQDVDHQDV